MFDEDGHLIERISDYEVKVLEKREDFPTPAELASRSVGPTQRISRGRSEERAAQWGFTVRPAVVRRHVRNYTPSRAKTDGWYARPLFHAALREARQRLGLDAEALEVSWLDSGKPVVVPVESLVRDKRKTD